MQGRINKRTRSFNDYSTELPVLMTFSSATPNSNYRPDIDGLRAIAVLSVILFHINKTLIPGGFVGVDIFFVISGFLISHNILQDLESGKFSIVDFYRRRVKRISLPMLIVVGVTLAAAQILLLPEDAKRTAISALWSLLSLANVYFWLHQNTDYFAAASGEMPLLHLWSLGVEEQFYIVWPLLLIAVYHPSRAKWIFVASTLVAIASFLIGELLFLRAPSFVYYMLPTRAGELLLGAIAALAVLRGHKVPSAFVAPMATLGSFLLGATLFLISEEKVFPGMLAIPPTLGTALLIIAGHGSSNFVSRSLAFRPLVWIGLISYSFYLWHWPLLAFYRYGHQSVGMIAGTVIFMLSLLLAWLTYRYVERPARLSQASMRLIILRQYIAPAGVLACVALGAWEIDGFGIRWTSNDFKNQLAALHQETQPAAFYDYVCQRWKITRADMQDEHCVVGAKVANLPQAILWGDSNAAHYIGMISTFAIKEGFRFRNLEVASCPPIFGDPVEFVSAKRLADCRESVTVARPVIESFKTVIVSASWTTYQERSPKFLDTFFDTASALAREGRLVILIGKVPIIPDYDRRCREKTLIYPYLNCQFPSVPLSDDVAQVNARLREFARNTPNVKYFDVTPYLCPHGLCSAFDLRGKPRYYDSEHLSMPGSLELGTDIWQRDGVPPPFNLVANWPNGGALIATASAKSL